MYTGSGRARRYRAGFGELEDWAVYGAAGSRDGGFFGIQHAYPQAVRPNQERMPLGCITFFAKEFTYPEAPYFVYPRDPARLARYLDIWKVSEDTIYRRVWDDLTLWTYAVWPTAEYMVRVPGTEEWDKRLTDLGPQMMAMLVRMVTGPAADFETNWAAYDRLFQEAGTPAYERSGAAWMAEYYRTQVLPNRIKR